MAIKKQLPFQYSLPRKRTFSEQWADACREVNLNRRLTAQRKPQAFAEAKLEMERARYEDLGSVVKEFKGERRNGR